jgi:hypothetical protein
MFTRQLQDMLDQRISGVDVINAGVPGYGTAQELLLARELHDRYDINAQIYLLIFFTNDILDNLRLSYGNLVQQPIRPGFVLTDHGQPVLRDLPKQQFDGEDDTLAERGPDKGLKTLSIAKALSEEWLQTKPSMIKTLSRFGFKTQIARMPALLNGWYRDDITVPGVALTRGLLRLLQQEVGAIGGQLLVSMVPSPLQVYADTYVQLLQKSFPGDPVVERFVADPTRAERIVEEICREAGIPFQDLLPAFLANNDRALFVPRDGHLNDAGHTLVSHGLLDFVVSQWPEGASADKHNRNPVIETAHVE